MTEPLRCFYCSFMRAAEDRETLDTSVRCSAVTGEEPPHLSADNYACTCPTDDLLAASATLLAEVARRTGDDTLVRIARLPQELRAWVIGNSDLFSAREWLYTFRAEAVMLTARRGASRKSVTLLIENLPGRDRSQRARLLAAEAIAAHMMEVSQ